jgi:hypothetical protein
VLLSKKLVQVWVHNWEINEYYTLFICDDKLCVLNLVKDEMYIKMFTAWRQSVRSFCK